MDTPLAALLCLWIGLALSPDAAAQAPKPLYRDPVYDGAADASLVFDRNARRWVMFYTNRRATLRLPDVNDVAWVHATRIGMATSEDGLAWRYAGEAEFPSACAGTTLWAPELYYEAGVYHMWLTVVPTVDHDWGPGKKAHITHITSTDLKRWRCSDTVPTGTSRAIDAAVVKLAEGRYRLWFKDEPAGSGLYALDSDDLVNWKRVSPEPVMPTSSEGPKVFFFKGWYWMIADEWRGIAVLRSRDAAHWEKQSIPILREPGSLPSDRAKGQHADVVVNGDRAFIYYFVHQENEPEAVSDRYWRQRTVIQVAELQFKDGWLAVDRDAPVVTPLEPAQ